MNTDSEHNQFWPLVHIKFVHKIINVYLTFSRKTLVDGFSKMLTKFDSKLNISKNTCLSFTARKNASNQASNNQLPAARDIGLHSALHLNLGTSLLKSRQCMPSCAAPPRTSAASSARLTCHPSFQKKNCRQPCHSQRLPVCPDVVAPATDGSHPAVTAA